MKNLLIVYHSQSGKNLKMAEAVYEGCCDPLIEAVDVRLMRAGKATAVDLLWADGLIFGTPENFGYMSTKKCEISILVSNPEISKILIFDAY